MNIYTRHIEREARGGHLCGGDYDSNLLARICTNMKRNAHTEGRDSTQHILRNTLNATHSTQHIQRNTVRICANMKRNRLCSITQDACIVLYQTRQHMVCLPLADSFKLQVSFAEYRLFNRALLQKRPIILRSLLMVATPYCFCDAIRCPFAFSHVVLASSMPIAPNFSTGMTFQALE